MAETGENLGELSLFVAGDYSFKECRRQQRRRADRLGWHGREPALGAVEGPRAGGDIFDRCDGQDGVQLESADGLEVTCQ